MQMKSKISVWCAALLRVRWIVRAPIGVYRARMGVVFGRRLIMLEHIGRQSGRRRYVVLEVVSRPTSNSYVVASGFGENAQWLQNVRADPHVLLHIASHRPAPATARVLSAAETANAIAVYAAAHPKAWAALKQVFETTLGTSIDGKGTDLPLIRFDLAMRERVRASDFAIS